MGGRAITATELRARLLRAGHDVAHRSNEVAGLDVWPSPDTIMTVALDLDPTLRPAYRERYFACLLEFETNPVPVIQFDADFALPGLFETIAVEQPVAERFMVGPFRWLLSRLSRHLLLWPSRSDHGKSAFASVEVLEFCPELGHWLRAAGLPEADVGAVVLDLADQADCRVLWKVASYVAQACDDIYVSDLQCTEVYRMHHHDKIVVSIPDPEARQALLHELMDQYDVLENCSGYSMPTDEE